ncbi:BTAD domain-containing putative transcriptional regulator [Streptomyces sp. BR1]|uniref:BTAD domain-containing putative transcriptional regulator n=1 Tax=Streptomyces sp. BR1 TaxID=1592323 RepID=UPI00402B3E1A
MGDIRFTVLGAVRILRDGAATATGSPQQQALLSALLLRSGRGAAAHELITAVWGEEAPDSALANLRTYMWRLRQAIEEDRSAPTVLVSLRDGYRMELPPGTVDAHRAELLADQASAARAEDRHDECRRLLTEAVELWQGEPLAGVPGPFAEQQRDRFVELRLALLEERFDHDLFCGRHNFVIPDLTAFTKEHPLRERPYGFLMRALYRTGRQADALAVFTRARQFLREELGVDPGAELSALHQAILTGDPALAPEGPVRPPSVAVHLPQPRSDGEPDASPRPLPTSTTKPAQLPADIADFTGRTETVDQLCAALTATDRHSLPVLAVTGMGGIGKTAVTLRAAHRAKHHYPDGQLYADLRGNEREPVGPGTLLATFLTTLGVPGHAVPTCTDDRARLFRTVLDGRRVLLLLDNVRDLAQIQPLLPGSAGCAVLVTSRAHLVDLPTSFCTTLDLFGTDEALALLGRIAGTERMAAEPAAATELVSSCGHLPLAVRIVAARLAARPRWNVATMASRLADERRRIGELRVGDLAVAAAFELGHRQLSDDQARAFRLLAPVARPDISLAAAAAALGLAEHDTEDLLESLVDAAMLEAPQPGRYRYHDLVRAFALQLPPPAAETRPDAAPGTLAALLDFLLAGGRAAFQQMVPGDPADLILRPSTTDEPEFTGLDEARTWVITELDCVTNAVLLAAGAEADPGNRLLQLAADLLIALSPFGRDIAYGQLAAAARAVAATAALRGDDRAAGRAHFVCGNAALQSTSLAEAEEHAAAAAEACRRSGDTVILCQTLNDRGLAAQFLHRYADAVHYYDQAISLARELGQRSGELATTLNAALARIHDGRADEASGACQEALPRLRAVEDHHGIAYALYVQGLASHELGRYEDALASYHECLAGCAAAGIRGQTARTGFRLADTLRALGRLEEARDRAHTALALCEELGAERDQGQALLILARIHAGLGHRDAAFARGREAHEVFLRLRLPDAAQAQAFMAGLEPPNARGPRASH